MTFNNKLEKLFYFAAEEAIKTGWTTVTINHVLLAILRDKDNAACRFLQDRGVNIKELQRDLFNCIDLGVPVPEKDRERITACDTLHKASRKFLRMIHDGHSIDKDDSLLLLKALLSEESEGATLLINSDIRSSDIPYDIAEDYNTTGTDSLHNDRSTSHGDDFTPLFNDSDFSGFSTKDTPPGSFLETYGEDLTKAAELGNTDQIFCRDKEIDRAIAVLCRRKKNNPIIVGEPGVGKTSVAVGIAQRIAGQQVPADLLHKRIISIDFGKVISGTKLRGEFEERVRKIIDEVKENPDIILLVDEIHNIVGVGNSDGAMGAADIMKPALSRGEICCIGTTTTSAYRRFIEKDGALARRFQVIQLEPPTEKDTMQILEGVKAYYESFHNVIYTQEALKACISLSAKYITDRSLPDKAIDLMDEAGSAVHIKDTMPPARIQTLRNSIMRICEKKRDRLQDMDFTEAAKLRREEAKKEEELANLINRLTDKNLREARMVVENHVYSAVSNITGIPVSQIHSSASDPIVLKSLNSNIRKKVVGQNSAIDSVTKAVIRNSLGLRSHDRPIGTFLFLGPTGVGKTHLAKTLAEEMFGTKDAVIRLDMSEYMEKISVTRLIGAPPGYVGYNEGGQLSERVRQKPYSIVLLDEIEKAHTDIFNILLQIMDEGRLTDGSGRFIDFRNTIVIMTSNVGSRELKSFGQGLGFETSDANRQERKNSIIDKALNKVFSPEFLNRLDECVYFNSLKEEDVKDILEIELNDLRTRMREMKLRLQLTEQVKDFLCQKGFNPQYSARPLKRVLRQYLEDPIAELILNHMPLSGYYTVKVRPSKDSTSLHITFS